MIRKLRDFKVTGRRVLVRCDFNVPINEAGLILDDFRIRETLPTIRYLVKKKAKIILMSHLGEPEGKFVSYLTLDKIQERLAELSGLPITKAPDCVGYEIRKYTYGMEPGQILLLENLRFYKEEKQNNPEFAKALSQMGDIYINDAFGVCHRPHASIIGVPKYLVENGIGFLMEKEIRTLEKIMQKPRRPMLAIVGGEKVETKSKLIANLLNFADKVLISGLIKKEIDNLGIKFKNDEKLIKPVDAVTEGGNEPDIGPKTIEIFKKEIKKARTIFWNGPLGMVEKEEFSKGTFEIANAIAKKWFCFSVVGGGTTVEFLTKIGLLSRFDHVSTGGGALLTFLAGEPLIGLQPLIRAK